MKKYIFAIMAVIAVAAAANVNAQEVRGFNNKSLLYETLKDKRTVEYFEAFASRKHDATVIKSDTVSYWKGRYNEGFFLGATGGVSYLSTASAFSYVVGMEAGYTLWWGDFLVTGRVGNVTFDGLTYLAPSAFAEARFNLARWGRNKQHRFYIGGRVGYQYTESRSEIETENFSHRSSLSGSGLSYGAVLGWEVRQFMSGNRFGIQLAAYSFDVQHGARGSINHETVIDKNITKRGWQVELTLRYSFQFGKVKKNY